MRFSLLTAVNSLLVFAEALETIISTSCNQYAGVSLANGVSQWLGIPYAAKPIGDLRFTPPQNISCDGAVHSATTHGDICLTTGASSSLTGYSEDCLYLDVYAPSNATDSSALPVFLFIQGGGFNGDGNPNLNGSGLVTASDGNIIVVTFNYRVGPYGFLTDGDQVTPNIGLLDQRKAMEWTKQHISNFGGDPNHVVLGGDSAGAASISLHLTAYNAAPTNLFHAVAMESVSFAQLLKVEETQYMFDYFAIRLGCAGDDPLACLKNKTAVELQDQNRNIPFTGAGAAPLYMWNPVIDNSLITDYTYNCFASGNFLKIPILLGDDTNGGTVFVPKNTSTLAEGNVFLKNQFPGLSPKQLGQINELFPNPSTACPSAGCYWRQTANAYGNIRYMCPNLFIARQYAISGVENNYNYRYNVIDPTLFADGYGVPHTTELNPLFGPYNVPNGSSPLSYYPNGVNAMVVPVIQAYWTSFIRTFNPSTYKYPGSAIWESVDAANQSRLLFATGGSTAMETIDAVTQTQCTYLQAIGLEIRQ